MKRLFVAIELPQQIKDRIREAVSKLRVHADENKLKVGWTRPGNVHLTLKFLGGTDETRIPELAAALNAAVSGFAAFETTVKGVGAFPNERAPRVLWIGLEDGTDELSALAQAVEAALEPLGFAPEKRKFSPHLTIGRVKFGRRAGPVLEPVKQTEFGSFRIGELVLFESVLKPSGSEYTALGRFLLHQRAAESA